MMSTKPKELAFTRVDDANMRRYLRLDLDAAWECDELCYFLARTQELEEENGPLSMDAKDAALESLRYKLRFRNAPGTRNAVAGARLGAWLRCERYLAGAAFEDALLATDVQIPDAPDDAPPAPTGAGFASTATVPVVVRAPTAGSLSTKDIEIPRAADKATPALAATGPASPAAALASFPAPTAGQAATHRPTRGKARASADKEPARTRIDDASMARYLRLDLDAAWDCHELCYFLARVLEIEQDNGPLSKATKSTALGSLQYKLRLPHVPGIRNAATGARLAAWLRCERYLAGAAFTDALLATDVEVSPV